MSGDNRGAEIYSPQNILITGAAGFIGSHVATLLATKYPKYKARSVFHFDRDRSATIPLTFISVQQVVVFDKLDYCSSPNNLSSIAHFDNFKFIKGDVCSSDFLLHVMRVEAIDTVLHFAAQTHVDNSFGNSFEFTHNNIFGTHVLLETVKTLGTVRRFIHVSTDEVYGESSYELEKANIESVSLLEPTNPYSATKAAAEMLVMAYGRSYNIPYIITRGNNVYGPRQYPEKAIPKFIMLAQAGRAIPIHGDGMATRSYMHVNDAASAFDVILHKGGLREIYNIGAMQERTVLSVAHDIGKALGVELSGSITFVSDRKFNDRRYFIDCSKLYSLGWTEQIPWEDGLRDTVEWYKANGEESGYWLNLSEALLPHPGGNRSVFDDQAEKLIDKVFSGKK